MELLGRGSVENCPIQQRGEAVEKTREAYAKLKELVLILLTLMLTSVIVSKSVNNSFH